MLLVLDTVMITVKTKHAHMIIVTMVRTDDCLHLSSIAGNKVDHLLLTISLHTNVLTKLQLSRNTVITHTYSTAVGRWIMLLLVKHWMSPETFV